MPITGEVIVWSEPTERNHLQLLSGDIQKALEWFKDKTRKEPGMIVLNPKNEHLAEKVNESIKVHCSRGCLLWEIWLAEKDNFIPSKPYQKVEIEGEKTAPIAGYPDAKMSTLRDNKSIGDISKVSIAKTIVKRRGEYKQLPLDFINQLDHKGMGSKAIASRLKAERGIKVSYKTIQRYLSGQRQELK